MTIPKEVTVEITIHTVRTTTEILGWILTSELTKTVIFRLIEIIIEMLTGKVHFLFRQGSTLLTAWHPLPTSERSNYLNFKMP